MTEKYNELEFFALTLGKIPEEKQKEFLSHHDLQDYKHYLEQLFASAKHDLSEKEEQLLNLISKGAYGDWVDMVSTFYSLETVKVLNERHEKITISISEISKYLKSSDDKVQKYASKSLEQVLEKHIKTAEREINAILYYLKTLNKLRNFKRADERRLLSEDMDAATIDVLIEAVSANFGVSAQFYDLKAKLLGKKVLTYNQRNIEYGKLKHEINVATAVEVVHDCFMSLDPIFGEYFESMLCGGNIDFFPKKGKSGGAFCVSITNDYPAYILLNYNNEFRDVSTLAHEMGHAIHHFISSSAQNALNADYPMGIAEVASTFMEDFANALLVKELTLEEQLIYKMLKLDDDISTVHRQIACYIFELALYDTYTKENYLPEELIGEIFEEKMSLYLGKNSKGAGRHWAMWSHIRRPFYVYSYASGLLISKALQERVRLDPRFIDDFKHILSLGSSVSPKDAFLTVGIDITKREVWDLGLAKISNDLAKATELAKTLGKI